MDTSKDKIKWLNPSWIDSKVRNQFPHGAYCAHDVAKLVEAATKAQTAFSVFYEDEDSIGLNEAVMAVCELEQVLKPFKPEVGDGD